MQHFSWQTSISITSGHSDSDWAGDQVSRKSTSGGVCRVGRHVIKTWLSTQHIIALSSAEVELYALLKCTCQTLGIVNLALDFGIQLKATVHTDASAALAITHRQGLGKLKHIDFHWLWIQERVKNCNVSTHKVNGKDNPADLFTKLLPREDIQKHVESMNFTIAGGRADKSFTINIVIKGDFWIDEGQCKILVHNESRRQLCDPFQCRGGGAPQLNTLTSIRFTHGTYEDGTTFVRQDNWTCKTIKNLDMGNSWTFRSVFIPKMHDTKYVAETRSPIDAKAKGAHEVMPNWDGLWC